MNTSNRTTIQLLSVIVLAMVALLSGCTTGPRDYFYTSTTQARPAVTNAVPIFSDVDIITAPKTNLATGIISAPVVKPGAIPTGLQTVIIQPPAVTTYENGPNVANLQGVAGVIPGWGSVVSLGILGLASLGKLWLNRKNVPIITTTFQTIEDWANAAIASGDPKSIALATKLKENLAKAHDYADVASQVQALLDSATGNSNAAAEVAAIARKTT